MAEKMKLANFNTYNPRQAKTPQQIVGRLAYLKNPRNEPAEFRKLLTPRAITQTRVGVRLPDRGQTVGHQVSQLGPKDIFERIASCGGSILPYQKLF